jgi:polar amino acid transport system substrate-binding protein
MLLKTFLKILFIFALTQAVYADAKTSEDINKLKAFVDSGIAYIKEHGAKKAYAEFNNPNGKFKQGELYLFVYDFNGTCLADGATIGRVGKNFYTELDKYGTPVTRLKIALAKTGAGFLSYYWPDPNTKEVHIKTSYIKKENNTAIGAGIYKAIDVPQNLIEIKLEEVKAFINTGIEYFKKHGAKKAYKEFANPNGPFRRGNRYFFIMSYKGIMLADGADPKEVGQDFYNVPDEFGTPFIQLFIQIAKEGGGSVSYYWLEPTTKKNKLKVAYVMPLDKNSFIASGFYGD